MERLTHRVILAREILPKGGVGCELGVCDGTFSEALLRETQPSKLYLVDLWKMPAMGYNDPAVAMARCRDRFADCDHVELVRRNTVEWLAEQRPSSLTWGYADSNHSHWHVLHELCQLFRVVAAGGWIWGHDYGVFTPGVVTAVDEFCRLHGQRIAYLTDEQEGEPWLRMPWMPKVAACNSYAIQVEK